MLQYFILPLVFIVSTQIVYQFNASKISNDYWVLSNYNLTSNFTQCNGQHILGGVGLFTKNSEIMRYFELPAHYRINISLQFYKIDNWYSNQDNLSIILDDIIMYNETPSDPNGQQLCGNTNENDEMIFISIESQHNSSYAVIQMNAIKGNTDDDGTWGLSSFNLTIEPCPDGCLICEQNIRLQCILWSIYTLEEEYLYFTYYYTQLYGSFRCLSCSQQYILPDHDKVMIKFRYYNLENKKIKIVIDNFVPLEKQVYKTSNFYVLSEFIFPPISHTNKLIVITIQQTQGDYILRLKDFQLFVHRTELENQRYIIGCSNIIGDACWKCEQEWMLISFHCFPICGDMKVVGNEQCDDGNISINDGCFLCQFSCFPNCQTCKFGVCLQCDEGFIFDKKMQCQPSSELAALAPLDEEVYADHFGYCQFELNQVTTPFACRSICGDSLVQSFEECDDGNIIPNDGCYECKFSCILDCSIFEYGICKQCLYGYHFDVSMRCSALQDKRLAPYLEEEYDIHNTDQIMTCELGWTVNRLLTTCIPICGDSLIVKDEQCDDGNNIINDGCDKCKFGCMQYCIFCIFGKCQLCEEGFYLDNNKCKKFCKEGMLVPFVSGIENENTSVNECYNCLIDCNQGQSFCQEQFCLQCGDGYQLKESNCIPVCGDQIIIYEYEDCDDGNDVQFDGCFECKFQCFRDCVKCQNGICQDECKNGDLMVHHQCQSFCGNQIVTGLEECDDGNSIQYDGCFECRFSCPLYCLHCKFGECFECLEGYSLEQHSCQSQGMCGDGLVNENEQCDDGNDLLNDGCYNCNIEENWICALIPSQCSLIITPLLITTYINQTFSIQYVSVSFSEEITIDSNASLKQTMKTRVLNMTEDAQNITIYPVIEASTVPSLAIFIISIEIYTQISGKPILEVNLGQNVVNSQNIPILKNTAQISLQTISVLSPAQKQSAEDLSQVSQNIMVGLGAISVLSLFMGEAVIFQEILKLLQYQSYLKYINVKYPSNLEIFFQSTNIVSVSPVIKYLHVNAYLNTITSKQGSLPPTGKFALYSYDADLITNLAGQIIQCIGLIIVVTIVKLLKQKFYQEDLINRYILWMDNLLSKYKPKIVFTFNNNLYTIIKFFFKFSHMFAEQGLRTVFLVNSQDIIFKAFLYLNSAKFITKRDYISAGMALIIVVLYIFIIFTHLTQKNFLFKPAIQQTQFQSQFEVITLSKQTLFLAILVFVQENQVLQTVFLSMTNILFLLVLSNQRKMMLYSHFIQQIIEAFIVLFTMSTLIYVDDFITFVDSDFKISVGWCQITLLCLSLLSEISKFVVAKGKILIEKLATAYNKCKEKSKSLNNTPFDEIQI